MTSFCSQTFLNMVRGKSVSNDLREKIIKEYKNSKSYGLIAKQFKMAKSSIQYIIKNYKETKQIGRKASVGGKKSTSGADDRCLRKIILNNRRATTSEIRNIWAESIKKPISTSTCLRRINSMGYSFYKVKYNIWIINTKL